MIGWLQHRRVKGQSIPLLALMIVVLVGLVALSVDVGNTYAEQREVVRATNAAGRAGMNKYLLDAGSDVSDEGVLDHIEGAMTDNGLTPIVMDGPIESYDLTQLAPNERLWEAYYLDSRGVRLSDQRVGSFVSGAPSGASFMEIQTYGAVDTYFARVVGTDQLPVNAYTCVSRCEPINGVFPIGVYEGLIADEDSFARNSRGNPELQIQWGDWPESAWPSGQTLFFGEPSELSNTDVAFLRWKPSYEINDLVNPDYGMMRDDGNLQEGFEEARWPDGNDDYPRNEGGDNIYPLLPGTLTKGDWSHGFSIADAVSIWQDPNFMNRLEYFRANRVVVTLPIYNLVAADTGGAPIFHITRFGRFYIASYDQAEMTITLAMQQMDPEIACPCADVLQPEAYALEGTVSLQPRWAEIPEEDKPAAFTVMLDVSGSMNWSFDGLNREGGETFMCESVLTEDEFDGIRLYADAHPPTEDEPNPGCPTSDSPWEPREERRIVVARESLVNMLASMDPTDRIRVVAFNHNVREVSAQWYAPTDPTLVDHLYTTGQQGGGDVPTWVTDGGTGGPDAINRASGLIVSDDFPVDVTTGEDLQRVFVYLTDGVANNYLDGIGGGGGSPGRTECNFMQANLRRNTAWCQMGQRGGNELPISSMIRLSDEIHRDMQAQGHDDFAFYVLAMGRVDSQGLDQVATSGSHMFETQNITQVNEFLQTIQDEVQTGDCIPQRADPVNSISAGNHPHLDAAIIRDPDIISAEDQAKWADVYARNDVYGFVTIRRNNVIEYVLPIHHEGGRLVYRTPAGEGEGLVPGEYQIEAWIAYKGEDDEVRYYKQLIDRTEDGEGTQEAVDALTFNVTRTLGDAFRGPHVHLDMTPEEDVCAPPEEE